MTKLTEKTSTETLTTAAEVHIGRLSSHPKTTSLAAPVQAQLEAVEVADRDHHKKVLARMLLTGQLTYADSVLDDVVMSAANKALGLVERDRDDLRYRALFPVAPSEGVEEMASSAQDKFVANIIHQLRTNPDLQSLAADADPIEAAQAEVAALRDQRDAAYSAEGIAFTALRLARVKLIDLISSNRPRLELIFPKKKRVIASFFA